MPTAVLERPETGVSPGYRGLVELADLVGLALEPFQKRIARLVLEDRREALVLLPRGAGKTCLQAAIATVLDISLEEAVSGPSPYPPAWRAWAEERKKTRWGVRSAIRRCCASADAATDPPLRDRAILRGRCRRRTWT